MGKKLHYILRIGCSMCFIGHGAFGIITKQIWCNYFAVFGIGQAEAYRLMPLLGTFDILMGIFLLVYPIRIIPAWLIFWGSFTAMLRPLSGEPFAEFIERAGNYGAPFVFLLLAGVTGIRSSMFSRIRSDEPLSEKTLERITLCLQVIVFMLLVGHGWLNITGKKALLNQYTLLGLHDPAAAARLIGVLEIAGATMVLIRPLRPLLLVLIVWKITSELFYPHYEVFEWIERGGSYTCLLALWYATRSRSPKFLGGNFSQETLSLAT